MAYHHASQTILGANLTQGGFEAIAVDEKNPVSVAIAVDAMALGDRIDCVILVPGSPDLNPLTRALRARGVRVETASFDEAATLDLESQDHLVLGSESRFSV